MPRKRKKPDTDLGYRMMRIRVENNLSIVELGERLGRDKSTITRYENGNTNPDAETIMAYCKEFEVDPNSLLGWVRDEEDTLNVSEERFLELWKRYGERFWFELTNK